MTYQHSDTIHGQSGSSFRRRTGEFRRSMTDGFGWMLGVAGGLAAVRAAAKGAAWLLTRIGTGNVVSAAIGAVGTAWVLDRIDKGRSGGDGHVE